MNEMVNEASKRANDVFGDSKHGQEIHKMLKGKWDAKKVDDYLEELGGGSIQKNLRIIDFITKEAGLNPRTYDTKTLGKQISDLLDKLEVLYKDFTTGTDLKKFDDVRIKSKNLTGMVYAISGNTLVVKTANGLVKATKDDVEPVLSDGVMKEGNAFGMAVTQAKKDGKTEFEFNGKTYKVKKGKIEENEKETIDESINEENTTFNKWLLKYIDNYLKGGVFKPGSPEYLWAFSTLFQHALTDANFHAEAKKVSSLFKKAEEPNNASQLDDLLMDRGADVARKAKWDGFVIIDGFAYVSAMRNGGATLQPIKALKNESVNESDCGCGENINEAVKEPEVIAKIRGIVKNHQHASIKDPKLGKSVKVDAFSASAIIQVYDAINDTNKAKFAGMSIHQMATVAYKLMKK
jgi:hypothetical protein